MLSLSTLLSVAFYRAGRKQEQLAIQDRALLISDMLNYGIRANIREKGDFVGPNRFIDFITPRSGSSRITIIAPNGVVLLDNKASVSTLENHLKRYEVRQALQTGRGESARYSKTLGQYTYNYAVLLKDGNVLRISKNSDSLADVFRSVFPVTLLLTMTILLIADFMAKRLTQKIVDPINRVDFSQPHPEIYEELTPYLKRISRQRKRLARQLRILSERGDTIRTLTENMREGLLLIDPKGTILFSNQSAQQIFGDEQLNSKNILHIYRQVSLQQCIKSALAGERTQTQIEKGDRIYSVYLNPAQSGKESSGVALVFLDITERTQAEKMRREFSANVSHELKTPLTTIMALAEMIENDMVHVEDQKKFAGKISQQANRMAAMISDLIRLANFDENVLPREYEQFDIVTQAHKTLATLKEKADQKKVTIAIQGQSFEIHANRRMMDELIYNLTDNAVNYSVEGGVVTVDFKKGKDSWTLAVHDTGVGIPQSQQSRIFERFYRVDSSRSARTGGTGLGLSIVKHIVEFHGGDVFVQSKEEEGSRFICHFPTSSKEG